ncbi:MAG: ATP synthase F1 subunit delta [Rhodothermaeota bacterium MED-G18]|nr:MAG: ATP synthase F1 subunit delta [Rhodothermaeota bacterium MED-G18]
MINTRASERYAKSLLSISIDENLVDEIKSDIDLIKKSFEESREISNLYSSPIIPINNKVKITQKIFEGKLNKYTLNLLYNLIYRKRDNLIITILEKFKELYNFQMNIEESTISTTFDLDSKSLDIVKQFAKKVTGKKITLENTIDKNILGGFNLKIGDKMIDCTVSNKISELRKKLINN